MDPKIRSGPFLFIPTGEVAATDCGGGTRCTDNSEKHMVFSDGVGAPIGNTWQRVGAPPSRNERNTHPHFTYEQKKKFFMILHNIFWDDPFLIVEMS
jgi:hypothetical protein